MTLTDPQRRALAIVAAHPSVACSNTTDAARPCVSASVVQRLRDAGLVTLARPDGHTAGAWAGTTEAATITEAGSAAA